MTVKWLPTYITCWLILHTKGGVLPVTMIKMVKEKYQNYLYIEIMPDERKNAAFYEKHGFQIMQDGVAMQLCNYADKR